MECSAECSMESSTESSTECSMECSVESSMECSMQCSAECSMEPSTESSTESSLECSMECSVECSMECSVECSMECSMECSKAGTAAESSIGLLVNLASPGLALPFIKSEATLAIFRGMPSAFAVGMPRKVAKNRHVRVSARLRTGVCARSRVPCVSACNFAAQHGHGCCHFHNTLVKSLTC